MFNLRKFEYVRKIQYFLYWRKEYLIEYLLDHNYSDPFIDKTDAVFSFCLCILDHKVVDDHCGFPEHRLCLYCGKIQPNKLIDKYS